MRAIQPEEKTQNSKGEQSKQERPPGQEGSAAVAAEQGAKRPTNMPGNHPTHT
jgi:hypothetical protein